MKVSSQLSSKQQTSAQASDDEMLNLTPVKRPDSNVMSLVYPDGRVMTVQLQEQFA